MVNDFEIYEKEEKLDPCYGMTKFIIDKGDLAALLSGKVLYSTINGDEYAIAIEFDG